MAVARPVTHASRNGVLVASPIFSSSRTFSSSAFSGSDITCRASSARLLLRDPLGLVEQAQLFRLEFRHETDLFPLHRDLVLVHLALALGGEVSRRAHRQRVGHHAGEPRHDHRVAGRAHRLGGADHAGHETEVGGQAVVESVHHVAEEAAGLGLVPRLADRPGNLRERVGVLLGFAGQPEGGGTGGAVRRGLVELQVALDLLALLLEQHREEPLRAEPPGQPRHHPGLRRDPDDRDGVPMLRQELLPHADVAILDLGEPGVERRASSGRTRPRPARGRGRRRRPRRPGGGARAWGRGWGRAWGKDISGQGNGPPAATYGQRSRTPTPPGVPPLHLLERGTGGEGGRLRAKGRGSTDKAARGKAMWNQRVGLSASACLGPRPAAPDAVPARPRPLQRFGPPRHL